ncbi:hypothetical protein D3C87_2105930 [compost metagenome]
MTCNIFDYMFQRLVLKNQMATTPRCSEFWIDHGDLPNAIFLVVKDTVSLLKLKRVEWVQGG